MWHHGLMAKLYSRGVSGKLLPWLQSYLSNRSIRVVLSGQASEPCSINASVPQGSVLGPFLFSIFIDDLVEVCENELYMYADDSTLFARIRSPADRAEVEASLNRDLQQITIWGDRWKTTFEPTKCKFMTHSRKRTPSLLRWAPSDT